MRKLLLLLLLFMASLSFASQCINSFAGVLSSGLGFNVGAALLLTILIIALAYLAGSIFHNPQHLVFAKDELYHFFFSLLIVAGIVSVILFSCTVFTSFLDYSFSSPALNVTASSSTCYSGTESPQAIATCYVSTIRQDAYDYVARSTTKDVQYEMDSTLIVGISNPITGSVSLPFSAEKKAYAMQYDMISMSFAMPALISLTLQQIFLSFSVDLIQWLLPCALLLRILPPTRNMGNFMIGLVIAIYVIVPTLYALNGAMDQAVFKNFYLCKRYEPIVSDAVFNLEADPLAGPCGAQTGFWNLARLMPYAFFYPNLILAIVVTFVSGISKALKVIS